MTMEKQLVRNRVGLDITPLRWGANLSFMTDVDKFLPDLKCILY